MLKRLAQKLAVLIIEALVPMLLNKIEELIDKDLNNDGQIGGKSEISQ